MKKRKKTAVSIKSKNTIKYFNALLITIFITSFALSITNKVFPFLIWPESYCDVIGVSSQIITTLLSLIVSVVGIAIPLQNETFFGISSTKIYSLRKVKHYSILTIIIISILICTLNLIFYMLILSLL